jgi:acetyl/propionyl-CoA carboxylase alpha subunit
MGAKLLLSKYEDIPLIPGYHGTDETKLKKEASKIELPILIKASAGGGGKGMRIVRNLDELDSAIDSAKLEALNSFGDDKLLVEKYFENIRHIEVQIFGDSHGNVIHLFERECSIQRRHQKIIEESPSIAISKETREAICNTAVKIGKIINYENAGTVEFIYDDSTKKFYFLEVNTRLQVEHPVTENVTGLDLVKLQIDIANGLSLEKFKPTMKGHSLECRLYAEDPNNQCNRICKILKF